MTRVPTGSSREARQGGPLSLSETGKGRRVDAVVWLIVVIVIVLVVAGAFAALQRRRRAGGVIVGRRRKGRR